MAPEARELSQRSAERPIAPIELPSAADVAERIRTLFATSLRPEAGEWERNAGVPASVFKRLGDAGAFAARWPDGARSPGNVRIGALIVRETALASVGACIAVGTHLEVFFRALARSAHGVEAWPAAIAGERIGAFAVTEYGGGSTPTNCETLAERVDGGWVLSGHKHYVSNAATATDLIVFARTSRSRELTDFTVFLVPTSAPGVRVAPHDLIGAAASGTCMVDLEAVELPDERRVGGAGAGLPILFEFLRGERMAAASGGLAAAELSLEVALAWADNRRVGDRPLRQHQAMAHRLAALKCEIAAARALFDERVEMAENGRLNSADAALAKFTIGRVAWRAADEAMQILSARGYTEETGFAQLWRDMRIGRIGGGTDEVQLELVAQNLRPGELSEHHVVKAVERAAEGRYEP